MDPCKIPGKLREELALDCEPVSIFRRVRDIPYGYVGSRDPLEVHRRNRGTCSGKHLLLALLLERIGIEVRHKIAFHRYSEMPRNTDYPPRLSGIVRDGDGIPDYHNFIEARMRDSWTLLDATFDRPLREHFVVNEWDGRGQTRLSVNPVRILEVENPVEEKRSLLSDLPDKSLSSRERFLREFSDWLEELRAGARGGESSRLSDSERHDLEGSHSEIY